MSLMQKVSGMAIEKMPKVISPKGHAIADYVMAAGAFTAAALFFKSGHKIAGIGALVAGVGELTNPLITNFPGGVWDVISFPTHGRVDVGLTSMVASIPRMMKLDGGMESKFFYMHAAAATTVVALTDFGSDGAQQRVAEAAK